MTRTCQKAAIEPLFHKYYKLIKKWHFYWPMNIFWGYFGIRTVK